MRHALLYAALWASSLAMAQAPETPAGAEAAPDPEQTFRAGQAAFETGDYETALREFERTYAAMQVAEVLYNIALCHDRLGHTAQALERYREYLALDLSEEDRRAVRARAAELERMRAREAEPAPAPAPPAGEREAPPPLASDPGPWIAVGVGSAITLVAGALLAAGLVLRAEVEGAPDGSRWAELADRASASEWLVIGAVAGLAAGVAALGAGALWLALGPRLAVRPTTSGLLVQGAF